MCIESPQSIRLGPTTPLSSCRCPDSRYRGPELPTPRLPPRQPTPFSQFPEPHVPVGKWVVVTSRGTGTHDLSLSVPIIGDLERLEGNHILRVFFPPPSSGLPPARLELSETYTSHIHHPQPHIHRLRLAANRPLPLSRAFFYFVDTHTYPSDQHRCRQRTGNDKPSPAADTFAHSSSSAAPCNPPPAYRLAKPRPRPHARIRTQTYTHAHKRKNRPPWPRPTTPPPTR